MKLCLQGLFLSAVFFISSANAGLLIEPYAGVGQTKTTLDFAGADDGDNSGTLMGARLGYSFLLLSAGIDYAINTTKDASDENATITNMSAFVGVDLPILFRFWGEYFINSDIDSDSTGVDFAFKDGYSIGVGFTGLPFVSLNVEVEALNYDAEISGVDYDFSAASTMFSVSLPIDL